MSAKDPRRSLMIQVPQQMRGLLRDERSRGRTPSMSAAMRRLLERQIPSGFEDRGVVMGTTGPIYRLQLGRTTRLQVEDLSQAHDLSCGYVVTQLLAASVAHPSLSITPKE